MMSIFYTHHTFLQGFPVFEFQEEKLAHIAFLEMFSFVIACCKRNLPTRLLSLSSYLEYYYSKDIKLAGTPTVVVTGLGEHSFVFVL